MSEARDVKGMVRVEHREGGATTGVTATEVSLGLQKVNGPAVELGLALGRTVELGRFEFARIDVSVRVPCAPDDAEADALYERMKAWVERRLMREVQKIEGTRPSPPGDADFR